MNNNDQTNKYAMKVHTFMAHHSILKLFWVCSLCPRIPYTKTSLNTNLFYFDQQRFVCLCVSLKRNLIIHHTSECIIALCSVHRYLVISSLTTFGSQLQCLSTNFLYIGHIKVVRGQFGQSQYAREIIVRIIPAKNSTITKLLSLLLWLSPFLLLLLLLLLSLILLQTILNLTENLQLDNNIII